mmetsp:Transcript_44721/g.91261  ORF Transcript_44721/g.91261 Transcript_44721/m.91261 type:complete len:408 (+) Transcript_44721:73-1296(+)
MAFCVSVFLLIAMALGESTSTSQFSSEGVDSTQDNENEAASQPSQQAPKPSREYSIEQKKWLVRERLKMQRKFNDKMHKNDQLWDDIYAEFVIKFPDQIHRKKESVRDQWDKQQKMFREYCKTEAAFRAGRTSGLGRDQQEKILFSKKGQCHSVFEEFQQKSRPMSNPPTIYNGGNAVEQAQSVVQESAAEQERISQESNLQEDIEGGASQVEEGATQGSVTPIPCSEPSNPTSSEKESQQDPEHETASTAGTERKRKMEWIAQEGNTPLSRSTRIGAANTGACASDSDSSQAGSSSGKKRGCQSAFDQYLQARAAADAAKREKEKEKEREKEGKGEKKGGEMSDMMCFMMQMHSDRQDREDERAAKEAREQHQRQMQFMTFMSALFSNGGQTSAAPGPNSPSPFRE